MIVVLISSMLSAAAAIAAPPSPLALAEAGWVQCYEPNEVAKTCRSIASYRRLQDGSWENIAVVLLDPAQPVTLETSTIVRIQNAAVCGMVSKNDIDRGILRFDQRVLPAETARPFLEKIASGMASMIDKPICTTYLGVGPDMVARATIDGKPMPDQRVRWVQATDGYSAAPNPPAV